ERLEIALRGLPQIAEAFAHDVQRPIGQATHKELVEWFMKQPPDPALLRALMHGAVPGGKADAVREALIRGLVTSGGSRLRDDGASMAAHIGVFGWQYAPRDSRKELDTGAAEIVKAGYARLGMTFHPERRQTYEHAKPGSVEHDRLAHEIRRDGELAVRFEAD